jgi:hypothetical protein
MHPAPENCNDCELFAYRAIRVALRAEAMVGLKMNPNTRKSAIALLNAHRGTNLAPRTPVKAVWEAFDLHFPPSVLGYPNATR